MSDNNILKFVLSVENINVGLSQYKFVIDKNFFEIINEVEVKSGSIDVCLSIDKMESMMNLIFNISGNDT